MTKTSKNLKIILSQKLYAFGFYQKKCYTADAHDLIIFFMINWQKVKFFDTKF